jgi:hypothetical protein
MEQLFDFSLVEKIDRVKKFLAFTVRIEGRSPDQYTHMIADGRKLLDCPFTFFNETTVFQQILRRITTDGQLGKDNQVSILLFCTFYFKGKPGYVLSEIPDVII